MSAPRCYHCGYLLGHIDDACPICLPYFGRRNPLGPDPINRQRSLGVGRMGDNDRAALVMLTKPLTDDQLRSLHDYLREWKP